MVPKIYTAMLGVMGPKDRNPRFDRANENCASK